jgi:hypothetical protein
MDHFGIGAALRGSALVYFQSARKTGRTVSLVESVKDEDRIIFTNSREADRVKRLCEEAGKSVECVVVNPTTPYDAFNLGTAQGRTIFDHTWVEQFYLLSIERCERDIDNLQKNLSGYGEPHRETRRRAEELAKWDWMR